MKKLSLWLTCLMALISCQLGYAASYDIDLGHSEVGFRIRHLVSKTKGHFEKFSGTVDFDEKNPTKLMAEATIETVSIDTNQPDRDKHLKTADFFNVEKFPTMTFKSTSAKYMSENKVKLMGDLTLLGITKPVVLEVELGGAGADPWGNKRAGFSATGKINRKDYGMIWNKALDNGGYILGDEVEILIEVEAVKKK